MSVPAVALGVGVVPPSPPLPAATALSLPLWVYQGAILLWALWLANALIGWLRWARNNFV